MIKVLFVCLGNICRSPIAEATFRELVQQRGLEDQISCDSAGTAGYHIGQLPDQRTMKNAEKHGLKLTHRGRKLSAADLDAFDHIVVMDEANFKDVNDFYYKTIHKTPSAENFFCSVTPTPKLVEYQKCLTHTTNPSHFLRMCIKSYGEATKLYSII